MNSFKGSWKEVFRETSKKLTLTITRDNFSVDSWIHYVSEKLKAKGKSDSCPTISKSSTTINPTSSIQYQKQLTTNDFAMFDSAHKKITEKWELSSGTILDDVIHAKAKNYSYEQ